MKRAIAIITVLAALTLGGLGYYASAQGEPGGAPVTVTGNWAIPPDRTVGGDGVPYAGTITIHNSAESAGIVKVGVVGSENEPIPLSPGNSDTFPVQPGDKLSLEKGAGGNPVSGTYSYTYTPPN